MLNRFLGSFSKSFSMRKEVSEEMLEGGGSWVYEIIARIRAPKLLFSA